MNKDVMREVPGFEIGQKVKISLGEKETFKGEVIAVTKNYITVKNKNGYKESFMLVDFFCKKICLV